VSHDLLPPDPFANDPDDPVWALGADPDEPGRPVTGEEREALLTDLGDLAVFQELLEPRGIRGLVVDCGDCEEPHFHDWALLRSSLEQLLSDGRMRTHEPAFNPDHNNYATWEYCRGYVDGVTATESSR
jgi:hypothetical protein